MPWMQNFRELGLPTLLEGYNGKPALIKATGTVCRGKDNAFLEMCINVHSFPVLTRKSIHSLRGKMKQMVVHLGTTIEGHADDELPERIAFCCRLIRVDGFESPLLSAETISWLQKQAKHLNNNVVVETATSGK
ncbi:hypothetical protein PTSG_07988 [Salpingoeca rosetta]|uniref:Protein ENHANCED DISEASE RESISTANCE 2 C-terminal domain-containing protein n=1 Tax=Salpingoeca rosetta (strain ATCC 50818 / BSB-021) TaxID=946362 RepID=F2UGX6_SALR5|nr:uncharacterized protein PTSG_07988 [Salpingoeca rosetta]EGD75876.1 hypothetical protein PTSG_07988 [Salpingoeca rosetta]|eukprot:XP_004991797.1 hypothetical protein PTSG_07988 [Salpingoeca rosetta]